MSLKTTARQTVGQTGQMDGLTDKPMNGSMDHRSISKQKKLGDDTIARLCSCVDKWQRWKPPPPTPPKKPKKTKTKNKNKKRTHFNNNIDLDRIPRSMNTECESTHT